MEKPAKGKTLYQKNKPPVNEQWKLTHPLGRQSCSGIHNNSVNTLQTTPKSLQSQFGQKYDHNSARNK